MSNVVPKISQAGRLRVLREGRKNVHAGLVGDVVARPVAVAGTRPYTLTYNPYKHTAFVPVDGGEPVAFTHAPCAHLVVNDGVPSITVFDPVFDLLEAA